MDPFARIHNLLVHALAQCIQNLIGGLHARIRAEQQRLQIIEHFWSEGVITEVLKKPGNEALTGFFQTLP